MSMRVQAGRLWAGIRRRLHVPYVIDRDPDYRKTIFLAGTARSGTTWVSELINFNNEHRYVFEPFHPTRVTAMKPFGFRKYLRPEADEPELLRLAADVLSGRIHSSWTERFNRRVIAHSRLVKDIRANLFLKWLSVHFPGMPIVLVFRHPIAVARSYAKLGWGGSVDALLAQPQLVEDYLEPHCDFIRRASTTFERAVCIWCVETLVPLKQFRPGEIYTMFYERLIADPPTEIEALYRYLGKPVDPAIFGSVARPSFTARKDSAIAQGTDPLAAWQGKASPQEIEFCREAVSQFGLSSIYSQGPLPDTEALTTALGSAVSEPRSIVGSVG